MGLRSWLTEPQAWEKELARRGPWQRYSALERYVYAAFLLLLMWGLGVGTLVALGANATSVLLVLPVPLVPLSFGILAVAVRPSRAAGYLRIARVVLTAGIALAVVGVLLTSLISAVE